MSKTKIPASVNMSVSSKSCSKTPKTDQAKCHAPFSSREHVGSIMLNMSHHVIMSWHVMSCHVVTLETDPCVCHCQYLPTHVKDQNPCLCAKCQFQHSHHPPQLHLHVGLVKSGLQTPQIRPNQVPRPLFSPQACLSRQSLARKRPKQTTT